MERNVGLPVLLKLIFNKKPFGQIGVIFTLISLFVLAPSVLLMTRSFAEPFEKYDYTEIITKGIDKQAVVTESYPMTNVSVNGNHPLRIVFSYQGENGNVNETFQTFDLDAANGLKPGDPIAIKVLNSQAVIKGLEPFRFPFWIFYILPAIFFIIGSIFLLVALLPALKIYKLYKTGIVKEGVITSMVATSGLPVSNLGRKIMVDYYYEARNGGKVYGNVTTIDFSILGEKKVGDSIKLFVSEDGLSSCLIPVREANKYGWKV